MAHHYQRTPIFEEGLIQFHHLQKNSRSLRIKSWQRDMVQPNYRQILCDFLTTIRQQLRRLIKKLNDAAQFWNSLFKRRNMFIYNDI